MKDMLLLSAIETPHQDITDINDAKGYIQMDDLYSPSNQQLVIAVTIDNGNTDRHYYNYEMNERISIVKDYYGQVNVNVIESVCFC
jgi:hypothetical protein